MATDAQALAGLAVAVTRPARQNDRLLQSLRAQGADASAIPLLAIQPLQDPDAVQRIGQQLQALPDCHFAIFVSQNAAGETLAALQQRGMAWPDGLPAFTVGTATAAFLDSHGIRCSSPPVRMDSEGLLALPAMLAVAGQRGVIFRGLGGREALAQTLRARGATVDYCELYRRCLPATAAADWAQWLAGLAARPALVCVNSRETLDNLLAVDKSAAARDNLTLLVPGDRVAQAARAAGFQRICTAADATDSSTLDTVLHWYRS